MIISVYCTPAGEISPILLAHRSGTCTFTLRAKKSLECDWPRPMVFFEPNLKYFHVKVTVAIVE